MLKKSVLLSQQDGGGGGGGDDIIRTMISDALSVSCSRADVSARRHINGASVGYLPNVPGYYNLRSREQVCSETQMEINAFTSSPVDALA